MAKKTRNITAAEVLEHLKDVNAKPEELNELANDLEAISLTLSQLNNFKKVLKVAAYARFSGTLSESWEFKDLAEILKNFEKATRNKPANQIIELVKTCYLKKVDFNSHTGKNIHLGENYRNRWGYYIDTPKPE